MTLYYAVGGGLGHLARAKKVLRALNIEEYLVVTAHMHVPSELFNTESLLVLPKEWKDTPNRVLDRLLNMIDAFAHKRLIIDTFPFGILGDLDHRLLTSIVQIDYVARYVNWEAYRPKLRDTASFSNSYVVDHLHADQRAMIQAVSNNFVELPLEANLPRSERVDKTLVCSGEKPSWLIVHSAPISELLELYSYAQEIADIEKVSPYFMICTQIAEDQLLDLLTQPNVQLIKHFPASDFFAKADRIFSGCGFNVMQETAEYKDKHRYLPFSRKYDDQFLRARLRLAE